MSKLEAEIKKEFEEALVVYGGVITKICYYFSSDAEDFQDIRQEVLINLWKGWKKFRGDAKLSTWIYRISFNTCISYQRKEKKSHRVVSINEILNMPEEEEDYRIDRYNTMHNLIQRLNFEERAIILLWLDDRNYDEISELMGIKRNTIAVKLKRIKEKIIRMSNK